MEATRILYHLFKDKDQDPGVPREAHHAKWLKTASERALDALKHPSKWNEGPSGTATGASDSKGSWDAYKGSSKGHSKGTYKGSEKGEPSSSSSYLPSPYLGMAPGNASSSSAAAKGSSSSSQHWQGYRG